LNILVITAAGNMFTITRDMEINMHPLITIALTEGDESQLSSRNLPPEPGEQNIEWHHGRAGGTGLEQYLVVFGSRRKYQHSYRESTPSISPHFSAEPCRVRRMMM
jgi:hypothetical protein